MSNNKKENIGIDNSGDWNSGNRNSGDCNSGNRNSGYWNSGDCNSGDCNSGYMNSGDWNSGNWNSGFFNSNEPTVRMFNKDTGLMRSKITIPSVCFFSLAEWISEEKMTDEEKEANPTFFALGGYLKKYEYKEAFRKSWDAGTEQGRKAVLSLPNFDADIFFEISGIDVRKEVKQTITVTANGKSVEISKESAQALGLI